MHDKLDFAVSDLISKRLKERGVRCFANDCIADHIEPGELDQLEDELTTKMEGVLDSLLIDREEDHNTRGTARRMARMYLREVFSGRYQRAPRLKDFPNVKKLDELYVLGPIAVRSACAHHLCPIEGNLWCGVVPSDKVIGISKFARIADWVMSRPQIQEEAIVQLADFLQDTMRPLGLGVTLKARHACMTWRGVKQTHTVMTSSVMRGIIREGPSARAEFLAFVNGG